MGSDLNDSCSHGDVGDSVVSGRSDVVHSAGANATLLSNQMLIVAYAISVVILAIGLVVFTIMLGYLCFMYPDKANAFVILLGGPVVGVLIVHSKAAALGIGKNKN